MAPVHVAGVVSASSEDDRYPACNLTMNKKWLTGTDHHGVSKIVLQLQMPSTIHFIDIGYINVSSIEILVGCSWWPMTRNFETILPPATLQTVIEARTGKNKIGCQMFKHAEHLDTGVCNGRWDQIMIVLSQHHCKNKQMGIEFVRFSNSRILKESKVPECPKENLNPLNNGWKDSPLTRFRQQAASTKQPDVKDLKSRLLKISGTLEGGSSNENTLSRTAKMVLSSRVTAKPVVSSQSKQNCFQQPKTATMTAGAPHQQFINGYTKEHSKPVVAENQTVLQTTSLFNKISSSKSIRCTTSEMPFTPNQVTSKSYKFEPTKLLTENYSPDCDLTMPQTNQSNSKKQQYAGIPNTGISIPVVNSGMAPSTSANSLPPTFGSKSSKASCHIDGNFPNGADDSFTDMTDSQVSMETSKLTKSEIKSIKKCIEAFFNKFDIKEMDPDKVTLKELRVGFEIMYDITLDKGGRRYFRNATAKFLDLVMKVKSRERQSSVGERKRRNEYQSPNESKSRRISSASDDCEFVQSTQGVQCPICMMFFQRDLISDHAAVCGEEDDTVIRDIEIVSSIRQRAQHSKETFIDLSDNTCLTEMEKQHWLNFSKKPKPYHPRMDKSLVAGHQLMKCPTCGQYYKSNEIEEHSDECADKVNSGLVKRGLYFVKKNVR